MPTFNGDGIFGANVRMVTAINPIERQENSYPGLGGIQSLVMGERGAITQARGLLVGASAGDLAAAEQLFFSYYDGLPYVLVDTLGRAWGNVVLETFEPDPNRIRQSVGGVYFREYTARFKHLSI